MPRVAITFLLLSALAFLSFLSLESQAVGEEFVLSTDDGHDWVRLTSGEWLTGDLVSLYEDELTFDSEHFGVLVLELEDVDLLHSQTQMSVRLLSDEFLQGSLRIEGSAISIAGDGSVRAAYLSDLVAATPAARRERDNWEAELGLGATVRRGNTDTAETNVLGRLERRTTRSRVVSDYLGNFQETDGKQVANNHRVNASVSLFTGKRFFWRPASGQFFRDPFQNINQQWSLETGLGYEVLDTPRTDWLVSAGVGANFVRYDSVEPGENRDKTSPSLTFATDFETELTRWMDYLFQLQVTFLDEDSGAIQQHLVTALSTDLIGDLDLDLSFVWDRIQQPQQREDGTTPEKDDFRFVISVGLEF